VSNRITPFEAGWLEFLQDSGLAEPEQISQAISRIVREAVTTMEEEKKKRPKKRRRKNDGDRA